MKKRVSPILALSLVLALAGCSNTGGTAASPTPAPASAPPSQETPAPQSQAPGAEPVELVVFAAASMTETMNQIAELYKSVAPNVTLVYTFDSSGTLKTQIQEGADCDIFISAAQKQMNQLDASVDAGGGNTEGLDFVLQGTRCNLVENKVTLVVPEGNPAGISSFGDVATDKVKLIALGNSDVPVGQYSEEIFTAMGVWDQLNANQKITFGTNVKEVTSQVAEAAVDCGVVYGTDAYSAGLEVVAEAPDGTHKPVVYPAAVLNTTKNGDAARAFLEFLKGDECSAVFESVGFSIPA
ncbi:molybdate ABC transporter substrate-binding protein [Oscillospiraceae bacterium]|nr:molybdate ABC transporter substrate-binding protein [Oscillospiraceae bacterium]BDF74685.1 molybdate ABC transporter substrate-binding protein [Oscillospiraceae bacterium]